MQVVPVLVGHVASWKERENTGWCWEECRNRGRFSTELYVLGVFIPHGGHGAAAIVPAQLGFWKWKRCLLIWGTLCIPGSLSNFSSCQLVCEKVTTDACKPGLTRFISIF